MALYPLAPSYFGVEHVAVLDHVSLGTALSIPGLVTEPALVDVSLLPNPATHGWRVHSPFGFLGALDESESAEYPSLARLRAAGFHPATHATVEIVDGTVDVAVALGLDPWMVPASNQPEGSALLAGGHGALVDVSAGQLTAHQLRGMGTQQFFATLVRLEDTVLATQGELVLGPCFSLAQDAPASAPATALSAAFTAASQSGVSVVARAYSAAGRIAVDLPLDPAAPFAPAVPPLPLADSQPVIPPTLDLSADWEFTAPGDPLAAPLPTGARTFAHPTSSRPPKKPSH